MWAFVPLKLMFNLPLLLHAVIWILDLASLVHRWYIFTMFDMMFATNINF